MITTRLTLCRDQWPNHRLNINTIDNFYHVAFEEYGFPLCVRVALHKAKKKNNNFFKFGRWRCDDSDIVSLLLLLPRFSTARSFFRRFVGVVGVVVVFVHLLF